MASTRKSRKAGIVSNPSTPTVLGQMRANFHSASAPFRMDPAALIDFNDNFTYNIDEAKKEERWSDAGPTVRELCRLSGALARARARGSMSKLLATTEVNFCLRTVKNLACADKGRWCNFIGGAPAGRKARKGNVKRSIRGRAKR